MELCRHFVVRELWVECLIRVPYLSLGRAAQSCQLFSQTIRTAHFWNLKASYELRRSVDPKEFTEQPRLRYVRIPGLNHILHPGFEVYFSPFEMAMRAARSKDIDLMRYAVAYILRTRKISRPDWLAVNLAEFGYVEEAFRMITVMDLGVATLIPFFLNPATSEEMLNTLLERSGPEAAWKIKRWGEICLKIVHGTYTAEEIDEVPEHLVYQTAVKHGRFELISKSKNPIADLIARKDYAELDRLTDLSKFQYPFSFLGSHDSELPIFSRFLSHFTGYISSSTERRGLFQYKCIHDLAGFDMIMSKLPEDVLLKYRKYIPEDCLLAKILCSERIESISEKTLPV